MDDDDAAAPPPPAPAPARGGRRWLTWLRWIGTGLGVAYLAAVVDFGRLWAALTRASVGTLALALVAISTSLVVGAARWRLLMSAYGAVAPPSLPTAIRLYFVAVFYNTYLPGGVAGDLVRGVVVRDSFGSRGATETIAVVLVERVLGLLALFALVAVGLALVGPRLAMSSSWWWWCVAGAAGAVAAVLLVPLARRLAPYLPGRLSTIAAKLPSVARGRAFAAAGLLSLGTQLLTVITGGLLLHELHPAATFVDALFIVPLSAATAVLPISVGGLGPRDAVFVTLCHQVLGMSAADGLAVSLLIWATNLMTGLIGGVLQLARPLATRAQPPAA